MSYNYFNEKKYQNAKKRALIFFNNNTELIEALIIPESHLTRLIIAKSFGFGDNYGQPAFYETLKQLKIKK